MTSTVLPYYRLKMMYGERGPFKACVLGLVFGDADRPKESEWAWCVLGLN